MSHTSRLLVLAVAWAVPIAWWAAALLGGPSDATVVSPWSASAGADQWGDDVRVVRVHGDSPLRAGDVVRSVDGRSVGAWLEDGGAPARSVGDVVTYEVRRPAPQLDRDLEIDVTLTHYPVAAAVRQHVAALGLALVVLVAGSLAFWIRPRAVAARAFVVGCSLLPALMTASPWGLGAIDLAGGRGVWPRAGGEALASLGLASGLVAAACLAPVPRWLRRTPVMLVAALLVPLLGYGAWLAWSLPRAGTEAARIQASATVAWPALVATAPPVMALAAYAHARSADREDLLATRLLLLGVVAGAVGWLLLGTVPSWVSGEPLLPLPVLALLVGAFVVGCAAVSIAHYRLGSIEPTVRRGLVQGVVLALVAGAFVGLVRAVDVAANISVGSMLAGGLAALLLLPVAVAVQRGVRRLVYGDREFPHRVVSDLRRLDASTSPEEVLREMLELLARRLHLSYAAIEVLETSGSDSIVTSVGTPYGAPATVDLAVGGTRLGRLRVEVDAEHDPFGPGDRRLLEDVGSQVGALVQAVAVNRDLQRSRQRLVAAREEERRRIRRDLHDGLGPSLATLAMRLEAAQDLVGEDPLQAADLIGHLSDQAREEIAEVRRLVDGLRPAALDQLGLVSALRERATDQSSGAAPVRMPWQVEASEDVDPLPAAVEVAAYRIVLEAVNNAQRHSSAGTCVVTLRRDAEALHVAIRDTGTGLAPDRPSGVGLSSMRERAEELGGSFTVADAAPGTLVTVRLPLADGAEEGQAKEQWR